MTVVHIVLFKFRPEVTEEHKEKFVTELRKLKNLSCVQGQQLIVGGPSFTDPIERSKGYHFALLSFHPSRAALEEYQASKEHHSVTSEHLWPYKEDVTRFDFEIPSDESSLLKTLALAAANSM